MKIWQNGEIGLNQMVESYTIGKDQVLDQELIKYDVFGSMGHAFMLYKIGVLTKEEFERLKDGLNEILKLYEMDEFLLSKEDEDVHSKIEKFLTEDLGGLGKKIHTGRSRNDQVLVDLRLYSRDKLLEVQKGIIDLCMILHDFAKEHQHVPMPGYTHMRKAMLSSLGLWSGSFIESLLDDLRNVECVYEINNQNPLGSAAGYGVPVSIDRDMTTKLLGFNNMQNNVLYVQNSRGKIELLIIDALKQIMLDLNKLCFDILLFTMAEFNYFELPKELCTGSSIMPQKNNLDALEMVRANYYVVCGESNKVSTLIGSLPSGYNRDLQMTKEPLMECFDITLSSLSICGLFVKKLKVNEEKIQEGIDSTLFAADKVFELVQKGVPFREAYKELKDDSKWSKLDIDKNLKLKSYKGAPGNLGLVSIKEDIIRKERRVSKEYEKIKSVFEKLTDIGVENTMEEKSNQNKIKDRKIKKIPKKNENIWKEELELKIMEH